MTKEEKIAAVRFTVDVIYNLEREAHDCLFESLNDLDTMSARCLDKPREADYIKETICEILLPAEIIGELKVGSMPGFKCPTCGIGRMVTEIIADHQTVLYGQPVRVKDARIATCNHCKHYSIAAKEIERWEKLQEEQKNKEQEQKVETLRQALIDEKAISGDNGRVCLERLLRSQPPEGLG